MQLKSFISDTLVQIQEGVNDAIEHTVKNKSGGVINPKFINDDVPTHISLRGAEYPDPRLVREVEFDIAVTASEKDSGGKEAGIKVLSVSLGGSNATESVNNTVSRIKFTIPFAPPSIDVVEGKS